MPLFLLIAIVAPQAAAASPTISPAAATDSTATSKKTCRSTKLVGSQIPKRICHTQPEWYAIDNADEVNRSRIMEGRRLSGQ